MTYNHDDDRAQIDRRNARRSIEREKARKKKLFARRATIVGIMLLIVILVIVLIVTGIKALFSIGDNKTQETVAPTQAPTEPPVALTFNEPEIADDKSIKGHISSGNSAVYIYNKAAFEIFTGTESSAQNYADCISEFKASVGDSMTVYNMVIPSHIEFSVPKRIKDSDAVKSASQASNIKTIYESYTEDVKPINCYNALSEHSKEYIYFNTDSNWTGLGGYYAYQAFCEQTDQKVLNLSICTENKVEGYEGSLLYCDDSLYENLDTVYYWTFPYNTYAMRTDFAGGTPYETSVYFEGETAGPYTYGAFIWGDGSLFVMYNKDLTNGKKIAVVKDSYGNAMVPYFTANYEQVHVIDYRYFSGNLKSYCNDNGIDEVLFVNNIMATNSASQVDSIKTLFD